MMMLHNKYYILRHGEALSNVKGIISSWPETFKNPLTKKGREMIAVAAKMLKEKKISVIFSSDLLRTKQTAQIVGKVLKIAPKFDKSSTSFTQNPLSGKDSIFTKNNVNYKNVPNVKLVLDKRLREISFGVMNGQTIADLDKAFKKESERITRAMPKGESYAKVLARAYDFLKDTESRYQGETILIVSHESVLWILEAKVRGMTLHEALKEFPPDKRIHKGQVKELHYTYDV